MPTKKQDQEFIRRCIELSEKSLEKGDAPFGALIVRDGKIIAQASNNAAGKIYEHAEVLALDKAHKHLKTSHLKDCTLYSNCEPCPMCSFMAREYKVSRVVFALPSPFMGGHTKWNILGNKKLSQFKPYFDAPPEVISGILEKEAKKIFNKTPLWMFGSEIKPPSKLT
ncbi:MAG: nucleoside deaminase [Parcubacteria group bacterium]|jgi:tRNA(adenine34) deaminase